MFHGRQVRALLAGTFNRLVKAVALAADEEGRGDDVGDGRVRDTAGGDDAGDCVDGDGEVGCDV